MAGEVMPASVEELRLPAPPEPGTNGQAPPVPSVGFWRGLWHDLKTLARKSPDPLTAREEMMRVEIARLRVDLVNRETEIFRLKTDIELHKSEILIRNKQIEFMVDVQERARALIQADMAVYSSVQADIEARRQQQRGM
jgi:hypothetical protein